MPIPHFSKKTKGAQRWRQGKSRSALLKAAERVGGKNYYRADKLERLFDGPLAKRLKKYAITALFGGGIIVFVLLAWALKDLPDPNHLIEREVSQSTKIYDRTGENILYEIHGEEKRTLVGLGDIPDYLEQATITIEDKDFYKHGGFSVWAIFRTAVTNILTGKRAGGSTLTQQFIKNSVLTNEKTYTRKIKELVLAYRVEKKFTKNEILQMYLNEIPYGSTAYGVEAASRRYFNKSVKDVNLAEAAILSALPQAPSRYSPYGSNKDLLIARQHYILDLMVKYGYINEEEATNAKSTPIAFKEPSENIIAPHFVMYIKELLSEKYGEKIIEQGGLKIYTTLDLYKQKIAEETIKEKMEKYGEKYGAANAALVSLDPKTGEILAMVGSRDYFNEDIDGQVNVATSLRQPGSSIKPLVYAAAFLKGYTPDTVLYDVVTNFSNDPNKPYEPHNYDLKERGPVTMRSALAGSLNVPAVKTLYLAGVENVIDLANKFGYSSLKDKDRFGLSLVLGGAEVKLLEHANAFSAFAREGEIRPLKTILKIEDAGGKILEENKENKASKVLDAEIARQINDVLSDNNARAYIFGEQNYLTLGSRPVAAKTGTTNDYHDAWTIGYTPSIITGVWVGNSDNKEMKRGADGSIVAAPIWHDYMQKILGDTPIENFKKPEIKKTGKAVLDGEIGGQNIVKIDKTSGLLATEFTPPETLENKIFREDHCLLYYINKDDPRGPKPENPSLEPQFDLWESRVAAWAEKQGFTSAVPPTEYDNIHRPELAPSFSIVSPGNNQTITGLDLTAEIEATAPRGIARAEYYINNNLVYTSASYPFSLNKNIGFLNNGLHNLKVRVCDDIFNCSEKTIIINLSVNGHRVDNGISVSWASPAADQVFLKTDFPVILKTEIKNAGQIAKIHFYYKKAEENDWRLIASSAPKDFSSAEVSWPGPNDFGEYRLYAEAYGWNGQIKKTEEINIIINKEPETKNEPQ